MRCSQRALLSRWLRFYARTRPVRPIFFPSSYVSLSLHPAAIAPAAPVAELGVVRRMKRPLFNVAMCAVLILLANCWLYHAVSTWQPSFGSHSQPHIWQTVLGWCASIPQIPALIAAKLAADAFNLSTFQWSAFTSAVSILIYCPLVYVWSQRRTTLRNATNA